MNSSDLHLQERDDKCMDQSVFLKYIFSFWFF